MASWLTELYLDQINRALLDAGAEAPSGAPDPPQASADELGSQLQAFLSTHVNVRACYRMSISASAAMQFVAMVQGSFCIAGQKAAGACGQVLDRGLTTSLLAGYGRLDDLVYYATLRQVSAQTLLSMRVLACQLLCSQHCSKIRSLLWWQTS